MYMCVAIWRYTNRNFRAGVRMQRAVRYHTSAVPLFYISFVYLLFFFSLIRIWHYVFTIVSFLVTSFSLSYPARVHQNNNEVIVVLLRYPGEAVAQRSVLVDRTLYTNAGENFHVRGGSKLRPARSPQNL